MPHRAPLVSMLEACPGHVGLRVYSELDSIAFARNTSQRHKELRSPGLVGTSQARLLTQHDQVAEYHNLCSLFNGAVGAKRKKHLPPTAPHSVHVLAPMAFLRATSTTNPES